MAPRKTSPEKPKRGRPRTSTPSAQPAARADPNLDAPEPTSSSKSVARGFTASNASSHRAPDSSKKNNVIQIYTDADLSASDEVSSSGGDIPPRKEKQKADAKRKKEEAVVAADDAEDDDEEEEEYVVEKVVGHKFDRKKLLFEVKWVGYPTSDNTMEPEVNLEDNEKLQDYLDSIGGRPDPKTPARSDSTSKKRKLEEPSGSKQRGAKKAKEDTPTLSMKKGTTASGGRRKSAKGESQKEEPDWNPPPGSWEESIINIDTMEIGEDGILYAYVVWKDQKRSQHPSAVVNMKCPQKMLQFYEAHLQFNGSPQSSAAPKDAMPTKAVAGDAAPETRPSKSSPQAANGATADAMDTNGDDVSSEEDITGVKGVATAV